jgi:hypothetical protein
VDLGLQPGAEPDQLQPVADDLAKLADLRWGNPRLGQPPEAKKINQIVGVPLVVLDPPVPPAVPQRMRQMDPSAHLLEDIRRPIPAESRLDHHLGLRARSRHRFGQGHGAVLDADLAQNLASRVLPHDHRPPPVQVDSDVLSFHRGLLLASRGCCFRRPECVHARSLTTRGGP